MKFIQLEKKSFKSKREQGRHVERWFQKYMTEEMGFTSVLTYNSESPYDLIAFKENEIWLIQVRSGAALKWSKSVEIKRMLEFPCPPICRKLIARIDPYDSEVHFRDLVNTDKSQWRVRKTPEQRKKLKAFRARTARRRTKRQQLNR